VLPKKIESNIFLYRNLFQRQKATKEPKEFFKANQLDIRPKSQLKFFRPTNLKRGQIFGIWPKKGQPGNPGSGRVRASKWSPFTTLVRALVLVQTYQGHLGVSRYPWDLSVASSPQVSGSCKCEKPPDSKSNLTINGYMSCSQWCTGGTVV